VTGFVLLCIFFGVYIHRILVSIALIDNPAPLSQISKGGIHSKAMVTFILDVRNNQFRNVMFLW